MKMKHRLLKICQSRLSAGMFLLCTLAMLGGVGLQPAAAQQQVKTAQVTGMVTDAAKQPLIGVTVTLVDTDVRAVTDVDGMFHINVPGGIFHSPCRVRLTGRLNRDVRRTSSGFLSNSASRR